MSAKSLPSALLTALKAMVSTVPQES